MNRAYYNEIDPFAAAWLRELIKEELIANGEVDERDIRDVPAADLRGFIQCHFFAGIGGWSYALRLAGWPDDRPIWTGSCPCQPFSSAGKQAGGADDRHLWPHWARLIREYRPVTIFGEQVESAIAHGWIDAVFDDLEREGYACGAACLPAAGVGAPHIRQRIWFVADAERKRTPRDAGAVEGTQHQAEGCEPQSRAAAIPVEHSSPVSELGDPLNGERWRFTGNARIEGAYRLDPRRSTPWLHCREIACRDGKTRIIEPGLEPLAHGLPARVGRLRGYGNAIVPQIAAEVIAAYLDLEP